MVGDWTGLSVGTGSCEVWLRGVVEDRRRSRVPLIERPSRRDLLIKSEGWKTIDGDEPSGCHRRELSSVGRDAQVSNKWHHGTQCTRETQYRDKNRASIATRLGVGQLTSRSQNHLFRLDSRSARPRPRRSLKEGRELA